MATLDSNTIQVSWNASPTAQIDGPSSATSDVVALTDTGTGVMIQVKAQMTVGSPIVGDQVFFYLLGSCGDPDGAGGDEYASGEYDGIRLAVIDLDVVNPGRPSVCVPVPLKGAKVYAKVVGTTSGEIVTVSAVLRELIWLP